MQSMKPKKLLNIEKETVTLEVFPKPLTLIESILEKPPQNSEQRDKKGVNLYDAGIKKILSSISGFSIVGKILTPIVPYLQKFEMTQKNQTLAYCDVEPY